MSISVQDVSEENDLVDLEVELDDETHTLLQDAANKEGISLETFLRNVIERQLAKEIRNARDRLEARIGEALPSAEESIPQESL